jgi:hypothetical protein
VPVLFGPHVWNFRAPAASLVAAAAALQVVRPGWKTRCTSSWPTQCGGTAWRSPACASCSRARVPPAPPHALDAATFVLLAMNAMTCSIGCVDRNFSTSVAVTWSRKALRVLGPPPCCKRTSSCSFG